MKRFLQGWIINTLAVLVAVYIVKGIHYQKPLDLVVASLLLGILNSVVRPLLLLLTLPVVLLTMGLFMLVINAGLLYLIADLLQPHFTIDKFSSAFWGALVISIVSTILNVLTGAGRARFTIQRHHQPPKSGPPGKGPVIDI